MKENCKCEEVRAYDIEKALWQCINCGRILPEVKSNYKHMNIVFGGGGRGGDGEVYREGINMCKCGSKEHIACLN